jgi:hypothetical protein
MAIVFISYDRAHQDVVKKLVQDLRDDEHETWFDQKLEGGQPWWDTVLTEIRKSEIFVTALTPESLESQACRSELRYALDLNRPVLPIRLSAVVLPELLPSSIHELHVVDYFEQDVQTLKSLQRAIKKLSKAPPLPDPLPGPPAIPVSYMVNLSNLIDSDSDLNKDQQMKLVFELRKHYHDGRPAKEIVPLVNKLKTRDDLLAKVQRDLDELLDEIERGRPTSSSTKAALRSAETARDQPAPSSRKAPAVVDDMPAGDGEDQVPAAESQDGPHQLKLDGALDECRRLMTRALEQGECWVFEIDPSNTFSIEFDASATPPAIVAKADLRDNVSGAKKKALVALGWKVSQGTTVKASVAAAALYLTSGLAAAALLSRGVRDVLMAIEATRSWVVAGGRDVLTGPAADFAVALQRVAPDVKTIIVKRRPAEPAARLTVS